MVLCRSEFCKETGPVTHTQVQGGLCAEGGSDCGELCHVIMETEHHRILLYRLENANDEVQS